MNMNCVSGLNRKPSKYLEGGVKPFEDQPSKLGVTGAISSFGVFKLRVARAVQSAPIKEPFAQMPPPHSRDIKRGTATKLARISSTTSES